MNIPDKAIGAAETAWYEAADLEDALRAAAPFIAAQALRDAALDVDRGYSDAYHHGKGDLERWEKLHEASYWLRDRADAEEL